MWLRESCFVIGVMLASFLMLGCASTAERSPWLDRGCIPADEDLCIRIIGIYYAYPDSGHDGRLSAEDVARLVREFRGEETDEDETHPHYLSVLCHRGTLMELTDSREAEELLRLIDRGIEDTGWAPTVNLFLAWTAQICFEWGDSNHRYGCCMWWVHDDVFAVNVKTPEELRFLSPDLAKKLASLARKHSLRTWKCSNPEFLDPDYRPSWYVPDETTD